MRAIWAVWLVMLSVSAWGQTAPPGSTPTHAPASSSPTDAEQAQGPVTTLKVVTRIVAISAVVKSKGGEAKTGLTKDDFVLKQDAREVPIHYFSVGSDLPLTIALMVDTSGSQRTFIGDESLASDVFFATMLGRKEDRAMLVEFDTTVRQLQGLTNSASALHLALSGLSPHASAVGGTLLNDAVYGVAKSILAKETGRKAMVILTDGGDNGSRTSLAEAVEQAQRGDVQIYSILYSAWEGFGNGGGGQLTGADRGMDALQKFSEATGGRVFTVSRTMGLREIFAAIAQDLRLQYELGYTPPGDTQPNSYHKLELKAKDKKLSVQARKGFYAPP
jgi:Ca-activated chloride channel homolog